MNIRQIILAIAFDLLGFICTFLGGFYVGRLTVNHKQKEMRTEVKYEYRTDTIRMDVQKPYKVRVVDTMLVSVTDTVVVHDTTYLKLPREQKVYSDSTYRAVISGYKPNLDSMEVYQRTNTITQTEYIQPKKCSIGIGPSVGLGYVAPFGKDAGIGMYAGIGVSFSYSF